MEELKLLKVLKYFIENPYEEIYLRDLAKKTELSPFAVKQYSDFLIKQGVINDEKKANLRYFKANTLNCFFKQLKISWIIKQIIDSGLIEEINNKMKSTSTILFGSCAKGEDTKDSDIDLVIISPSKEIDVSPFEKKIKREINIHTFNWLNWKKQKRDNKAFYSDVIMYGVPLEGELPLME